MSADLDAALHRRSRLDAVKPRIQVCVLAEGEHVRRALARALVAVGAAEEVGPREAHHVSDGVLLVHQVAARAAAAARARQVLLHHIKQSLHLHAIARHAVVARLDLIRWSVREEMAQVALQVVAVVLVVSSSRSSSSSRVVVAGEQQYGTPLDSLSWYDFGKMLQ